MNYIVDTGFWIALFFPEKELENGQEAAVILEIIEKGNIIIPFPCLYEFLNSKFSRIKTAEIYRFEKLLSQQNCRHIEDEKYRIKAYKNFFDLATAFKNDVSLVDEVIKEMINDPNLKIDYLISFDEGLKNYATSKGLKTN